MNKQAALYLRSSKDRSDVSIAAQRRELHALAAQKGLVVVEEFVDAVESGKSENRPGFQSLYSALRAPDRGWDSLLMLDTSRLSRRQYISHFFEHEADKQGVQIIYKSFPDVDPISSMMLKSILQAMDQWHSMISKQKGLAGMAENVKQGFRAGGRAPRGYSLEKVATGAFRDGKPVTKTRLIKNEDAYLVEQYLKGRAEGVNRQLMLKRLNNPWSKSTAVSMEWNALTYAGHTVWNVHAERHDGKAKGGQKRRPRSEWQITKNTHPGLITEEEAEIILRQLELSKHSVTRRTPAKYLLSGILRDSDGRSWHGDNQIYYRSRNGKGKRVRCELLDRAFLAKLQSDLQSPSFITQLTKKAKRLVSKKKRARAPVIKQEINAINQKITKIMDLMTEAANTAPFMRTVHELEDKRASLVERLQEVEREELARQSIQQLTEFDVKRALGQLLSELENSDKDTLKDFIQQIVQRVIVDEENTTQMTIYYCIVTRGFNVASPRGFEPLLPP
jgi:site-specific DNA recombinase